MPGVQDGRPRHHSGCGSWCPCFSQLTFAPGADAVPLLSQARCRLSGENASAFGTSRARLIHALGSQAHKLVFSRHACWREVEAPESPCAHSPAAGRAASRSPCEGGSLGPQSSSSRAQPPDPTSTFIRVQQGREADADAFPPPPSLTAGWGGGGL